MEARAKGVSIGVVVLLNQVSMAGCYGADASERIAIGDVWHDDLVEGVDHMWWTGGRIGFYDVEFDPVGEGS